LELLAKAGEKRLFLGNEAILRGALEFGVGLISGYPGTPSSEVLDLAYALQDKINCYVEYSANEKVALEVAGGAALAGVPSLVSMKHVGLNVAADPLMTLAYIGTPGGLVILSADDPGCHSSQNEQDNRYYARLGGLICLEPATAQECKDLIQRAFVLSQKYEQPVLFRTTTRVNHLRGPVVLGELNHQPKNGKFSRDPFRFVAIPAVARKRHLILLSNLEKVKQDPLYWELNQIHGQGEVGVIVSGVSRNYLRDVLKDYPQLDQIKILELKLTYPLNAELFVKFFQGLKTVVVLEELEPVLEKEVRALVQENKLELEVKGKDLGLPLNGEYSTRLIAQALARVLRVDVHLEEGLEVEDGLVQRPPNLCPGCPHRATYYAVKKVFGEGAYYSSDIGCYTLGMLPPLNMADFLICMGASVSAGCGSARVSDKPVVAFIGDSTFFHSGLTGLVNAVYNQHDLLLVILDNQTTAMTGHQPHPGVGLSNKVSPLEIESVVRGFGIKQVKKVKAFNLKAMLSALTELKNSSGVRVLISEEPCPLFARKFLGKKKKKIAFIKQGCDNCLRCVQEFVCPAFFLKQGKVEIDPKLCSGCMFCLQICEHIGIR